METNTIIASAALVIAITSGGFAFTQSSRITDLENELAKATAITGASAVNIELPTSPGSPIARRTNTQNRKIAVTKDGTNLDFEERKIALDERKAELATSLAEAVDTPETEASRDRLRSVIAEEQQILRDERHQKRSAKREERTRERIEEFAAKHTLDGDVKVQLTELMVEEQAEVSELFRQAREDFTFPEAREKALAIRKENDEKAKDLLEEDAYADYAADRAEEAERFNRRGRGGRGGGGGNRPTEKPKETK